MPKYPKRSKSEKEAQRNALAKLYVRGTSQMEIAKQLGISQSQVSIDLKGLLQHWQETRLDEIDRYKNEQLARINEIELEMWEAWETSKKKNKVTHTKSKSGDTTKVINPATGREENFNAEKYWRDGIAVEEVRGGDMQYMNGIMWCVSERNKILGIYAPKKLANTNPDGSQEAGLSAKEELMGLIGGIVKRFEKPKDESANGEEFIEGELVEESKLPVLLQQTQVKKLEAYKRQNEQLVAEAGGMEEIEEKVKKVEIDEIDNVDKPQVMVDMLRRKYGE